MICWWTKDSTSWAPERSASDFISIYLERSVWIRNLKADIAVPSWLKPLKLKLLHSLKPKWTDGQAKVALYPKVANKVRGKDVGSPRASLLDPVI